MLQNLSWRWLGIASSISGVLYFLASALYGRNFEVTANQNAMLAIAALLSLSTLTGLVVSQNPGWVGLSRAGLLIGMLGAVLAFLGHVGEAIALRPFGILSGTSILAYTPLMYGLGYLGITLGFIVLGAGILQSRLLPAWLGITLLLMSILNILSSWFGTLQMDSISYVSQLAFAIPWLALGIHLVFAKQSSA